MLVFGVFHAFASPQAQLLSTTMPAGRVFFPDEEVQFRVTLLFDRTVELQGATMHYEVVDIGTGEPVVLGQSDVRQTLPSAAVADIAPELPVVEQASWYRMRMHIHLDEDSVPVTNRQRPNAEAWIAFGKLSEPPRVGNAARRTEAADPARKVMAFYYPWYGNPDRSGSWIHWPEGGHNPDSYGELGLPPIGASFHPILGPYDSRDPRVIEQHLAWAEAAGIDVLISSWWGQGDFSDHALAELLDAAAKTSVQVAFYYEVIPGDRPEAFIDDIAYLLTRYGDHPATFKHDGNAVVFIYDRAISQISYSDWQRVIPTLKADHDVLFIADREDRVWSELFDGLHSYNPIGRIAGGASVQSLFDSIVWEAESRGKISAVIVLPGYDDTNIGRADPIPVSRRDGALYDELWEAAIASLPQWIVVTSFNEWHEGSQIEPSLEHGDMYLHRTAKWAERFRTTPQRTFWVEQRSLPEVAPAGQSAPVTLRLRRIVPVGNIDVKWDLPAGWSYIGSRPVVLGTSITMNGDLRVPATAEPGRYPISLALSLGEYRTLVTSVVTVPDGDATPPFEGAGVWTVLGSPNFDYGIRQKDDADGVTEAVLVDGIWARKTVAGVTPGRYMYFDVADTFLHNVSGVDVELGVEYLDLGTGTVWVQYDSNNLEGDLNGAYTNAHSFELQDTGDWRTITVRLDDVRFANRQNAATDFRFGVGSTEFTVRQVYVKMIE